ncbi:MAG: hypothetical protein HY252_06930 [Sphingobacteriales bacterium]|nr:hypothetical protein [Sphingobacteriales bacterium]
MRIIILFLFFIAVGVGAFSQTPKKKVGADNRAVPTKNKIQSQMNEATSGIAKEIADLEEQLKTETDEETIKNLKEQIGMLKKQLKMMQGLNKNVSNMSNKVIQQAFNSETSEIPKRDVNRINSLPKKILNDGELFVFMKQTTQEVENKLAIEGKKLGMQLFDTLKARKYSAQAMGQYAFACMAGGFPEMGLYIYGKACLADMNNADNLNNYAAYLTMAGGEQYSIPILDNLNSKYPFNSTILNNLGQAWFGLGDMNKAKKNLEDAVRIYSIHSRANETLCLIQQSEGQTQQATESLKRSLQGSYSDEKKSRLEKLGAQNVCNQSNVKYPRPIDPIGVAKFFGLVPAIPLNIGEAETLHEQWIAFREAVQASVDKLSPQIADLDQMEKEWIVKYSDQNQNKPLLRRFANPVYYTANCKFLGWLVSEEAAMKNLAKHFQMPL